MICGSVNKLLSLLANIFSCSVPNIGNAYCEGYILTCQGVICIDGNFTVVDIGDNKMQHLALVILSIPLGTDEMQLFGRILKLIEVD